MAAFVERQIIVAGNGYTLKYSARAWRDLQAHYGLPSLTAVQARMADMDQFGVDDMVAIIWAGLRTHHRDVTKDDVLDMLDEIGLEEAGKVIGEAFAGAAPAAEGAAGAGASDPLMNGPSTGS